MRVKTTLIYALAGVAISLSVGVFFMVQPQEKLVIKAETAAQDLKAIEADLRAQGLPTTGLTTMTAPHFTGQDDAGRTWDIKAEKAVQQGTEAGVLRLYGLQAEVGSRKGQPLRLSAPSATYAQAEGALKFTEGLKASGHRFTLSLKQFVLDLPLRRGQGQGGVLMTSDLGQLKAEELTLQDGGDRVVLTGKVHARIKPRR